MIRGGITILLDKHSVFGMTRKVFSQQLKHFLAAVVSFQRYFMEVWNRGAYASFAQRKQFLSFPHNSQENAERTTVSPFARKVSKLFVWLALII